MNNLKKLLCIVLAVLTLSALTACGEEPITSYEPAVRESAVMTCGEETFNISYVYDEEGLLIKEIITAADGTAVNKYYIYNKEGQCTSEVHNKFDGTKDKFRHTWKGASMTKTVYTDPSGSKDTTVYILDDAGKCTGYTLTYSTKDVQEGAYTYNDLGAIAQIDRTGANPSVTTYEYDKHGSVIKQVDTENGAETVITYEYTYRK